MGKTHYRPTILYSRAFPNGQKTFDSLTQAKTALGCYINEIIDAILLGSKVKHNYEPVKIDGHEVYADYFLSEDNLHRPDYNDLTYHVEGHFTGFGAGREAR